MLIVGQITLGLLVTWLIIAPHWHLPLAFGQLLEVGWAGGFGTAAAWGTVFDHLHGFPEARDFGTFFAAAGLLYGVISGLILVNVALRQNWTRSRTANIATVTGLEPRHAPTPAALARVSAQVIDPIAFQIVILAAAFTVGLLMKLLLSAIAARIGAHLGHAALLSQLADLPLFLFTLLGGLVVREIMHALRIADLIDPTSIARLTGIAMEFLTIAALVGMRLTHLAAYAIPVLILCLVGALWCIVCCIGIARYMLPRSYWFELSLINYEMATATTAQGMMMLRIVDENLESGAAEDYALAAPLSGPFIGGGVLTMLLPYALLRLPPALLLTSLTILLLACIVAGRTTRSGDQ